MGERSKPNTMKCQRNFAAMLDRILLSFSNIEETHMKPQASCMSSIFSNIDNCTSHQYDRITLRVCQSTLKCSMRIPCIAGVSTISPPPSPYNPNPKAQSRPAKNAENQCFGHQPLYSQAQTQRRDIKNACNTARRGMSHYPPPPPPCL